MKCDDDIRKQWNEAAGSFARFVRSGKNYYSEFLNGPALKRMVGDAQGKRMLDIGCGEGCFSRFFAEAGAHVTGIDVSDRLINKAIEDEKERPLGIKYIVANAANLGMLASESFDIAFCYMALMDIQDYEGAIREVSRVLRTEGKFVILLEHPCFTPSRTLDGRIVSGWETSASEDESKEHYRYWIEDYFQRRSYLSEWKHERLTSSFVTTGFHRPLSDYVNALTRSGLVITRLEEPQPLSEGIRLHPPMIKHCRIPQSMAIEAKKISHQRTLRRKGRKNKRTGFQRHFANKDGNSRSHN
jgi:ubiquinone/menaquinone biosynthesis C-methylase UbiE